jgi:hypothetical protein
MGDGIAATAPASGGVGRPTGFTLPGALLLPEEYALPNAPSLLEERSLPVETGKRRAAGSAPLREGGRSAFRLAGWSLWTSLCLTATAFFRFFFGSLTLFSVVSATFWLSVMAGREGAATWSG